MQKLLNRQQSFSIGATPAQTMAKRDTTCVKYGSLAFVVVQNTALVIIGVYSRRVEGPKYLGSVAVLLTECLKTAISLGFALADSGCAVFTELREHIMRDTLWTLAFAVPSLGYALHNNLWYVAVTHLDPVTIAVMTQLKIVFAALFSVLLLGRRLGPVRWAAISMLVLGLAPVQRHSMALGSGGHRRAAAHGAAERDEARGMLAMVGLCMLSGLSGAVMERLLKDSSRASSLWVRNLQLALFSLPVALALVPLADADALRAHGPWVGLNGWAATVVTLGACGGVMVSVVFKYADNILKSFAVGISIAFSAAASWALFGFACSPAAAGGMCLVAAATVVYHAEERRSSWQQDTSPSLSAAPLLGEREHAAEAPAGGGRLQRPSAAAAAATKRTVQAEPELPKPQ